MLKIKLSRTGSKNRPSYRIVVAPGRSKLTGRPVDYLGFYSPLEKKLEIDKAKANEWIQKGALPTAKASILLKRG